VEIDGQVDERLDPVISITVANGLGESLTLDAVVDTGFNDVLSLPLAIIQRLNLQALPSIPVELADGSEVETDTVSGVFSGTAQNSSSASNTARAVRSSGWRCSSNTASR
jgi:predicted aspartyl protease